MMRKRFYWQKWIHWTCYLFILFISLNNPFTLLAQDTKKNDLPTQSACFVVVQDISAQPNSQALMYKELIKNTIEFNLNQTGFLLLSHEEHWQTFLSSNEKNEGLWSTSALIKLGQQIGANLAFFIHFKIADDNLHFTIKCYSVLQNRLVSGLMRKGLLGLATHNLIDKAINSVIKDVQKDPSLMHVKQSKATKDKTPESDLISISLLSEDEEATVYFNGEEPAGTIINGSLLVYTLKDAELLLEVKKAGFHSRHVLIKVEEAKRSYKLPPLIKETRWATELLYTADRFTGLGIGQRYYFFPDLYFLGFDFYFYLKNNAIQIFQTDYSFDFRLLTGGYILGKPEQFMHLGASAGLGLLLTSVGGPPYALYTDFYIDILNLRLETNFKQWSIFLQIELKYGLEMGTNLYGNSWYTSWNFLPPLTLGFVKKW